MSRSPNQRSAFSNGARPFLTAVPGSSASARRFKDLVDDLEAERGGPGSMSVAQREACRAYAGLAVQLALMHAELAAGRPVDPEAMGQLGDRMDRQSRRMGPPKAPAPKDIRSHLASRASA